MFLWTLPMLEKKKKKIPFAVRYCFQIHLSWFLVSMCFLLLAFLMLITIRHLIVFLCFFLHKHKYYADIVSFLVFCPHFFFFFWNLGSVGMPCALWLLFKTNVCEFFFVSRYFTWLFRKWQKLCSHYLPRIFLF